MFFFFRDDLPHVPNDELSTQEVIDTVKNITDLLSSTFPNTTVFPALGNHDYHPKHMMPPRPNRIYTEVGDLWSRWLPNDAVSTFKQGIIFFSFQTFLFCLYISFALVEERGWNVGGKGKNRRTRGVDREGFTHGTGSGEEEEEG